MKYITLISYHLFYVDSLTNIFMSKDKTNKFEVPPRDLQHQIEDYRQRRDDLNKKTKEYINSLQNIETEISNYLQTAKKVYKKKRDYWNDKVKKLKEKKIEYKNLLDNFIEEKKKYQKANKNNDITKQFASIKQIERKIESLERKIETENLNISEENDIVDVIKDLTQKKQEFLNAQQNENVFKLERKIEIVKINLNKIYEQLNKWSNKSQEYHAKMLELFQKIDELKESKKIKEEELIENKKTADSYHEQFLLLMNQRKKSNKGKGRRSSYKSSKTRPMTDRIKKFNKQNELLEKMKQDKLAVALEKQKAGKKLNLFEARLILEQPKS